MATRTVVWERMLMPLVSSNASPVHPFSVEKPSPLSLMRLGFTSRFPRRSPLTSPKADGKPASPVVQEKHNWLKLPSASKDCFELLPLDFQHNQQDRHSNVGVVKLTKLSRSAIRPNDSSAVFMQKSQLSLCGMLGLSLMILTEQNRPNVFP